MLFIPQKAYLLERLKVDGKVKNFGDKVKIELDDHIILIDVTDISFSKRYVLQTLTI